MGNPRQHRKARSSAYKVVKHSRHAKRNLRKMKPIRGPKAIQDAWDNKKTLRQNYSAMGLIGSLRQTDSGGSERPVTSTTPTTSTFRGRSQTGTLGERTTSLPQKFGKILRDVEGNVIGVELPEEKPVEEELSAGDDTKPVNEIVNTLEKLAESAVPVPRFSSNGETMLLRNLIAKHGIDYEAMAKDRRLNEWQRTAGQLKRAIKKAGLSS